MSSQRVTEESQQWKDCLEYMSCCMKKQSYSSWKELSFDTWLKPTRGCPLDDDRFEIVIPNRFMADWIHDQFGDLISESFVNVLGRRYEVVYVPGWDANRGISAPHNTNTDKSNYGISEIPVLGQFPIRSCNLKQEYNFDSLVVGNFNKPTYSAAKMIVRTPGLSMYNPFCIYGGTGLGKTHIVQAIGNHILYESPCKRVAYFTSEEFISGVMSITPGQRGRDFVQDILETDVLIIDDLQFFAGEKSAQVQFLHILNTLCYNGKQVILTCDQFPGDIHRLGEQFRFLCSCGTITGIQTPNKNHRAAILLKKAESEGVCLPHDVAHYVAERVTTNIRELEGALNRLLAYSCFKDVSVDLELAHKVMADNLPSESHKIAIETIQEKTSVFFNIDPENMKAKNKSLNIALARQVAMYLSRTFTRCSFKLIGAAFGGKDHSTVIHACRTISRKMEDDPAFREKISRLSASLQC